MLAADQGRGVRTPEFGDDASEWANDDECDDPRFSGDGTPRFGDDDGDYSDDGECDDMRFVGKGMGVGPFLSDDIMHDASDCKAAWNAGDIKLR